MFYSAPIGVDCIVAIPNKKCPYKESLQTSHILVILSKFVDIHISFAFHFLYSHISENFRNVFMKSNMYFQQTYTMKIWIHLFKIDSLQRKSHLSLLKLFVLALKNLKKSHTYLLSTDWFYDFPVPVSMFYHSQTGRQRIYFSIFFFFSKCASKMHGYWKSQLVWFTFKSFFCFVAMLKSQI